MELSSRDKAILDLGIKFTKELGLDEGVDTLSRWMAHYIAELIHDLEHGGDKEQRHEKMLICREAIIVLWKHIHELPNGRRPFEEIEPILRGLESLDPEDSLPRYYRSIRAAAEGTIEQDKTKEWFKLIEGLDYSAKLLIRYSLSQASRTVIDKAADWVTLAESAGLDQGIESIMIHLVSDETSLLNAADPSEDERKRIQDRITRLEGFLELANGLVTELKQQIQYNT